MGAVLEVGDGRLANPEDAGHVHVEAALPRGLIELLHRSLDVDARVVDDDVDAAEPLGDRGERRANRIPAGHVAGEATGAASGRGELGGELFNRTEIDVERGD